MKIHSKSIKLVLFICFFGLTLVNFSSCEDYERSQFYDAGEVELEEIVIPEISFDTVVLPPDTLGITEEEVIL